MKIIYTALAIAGLGGSLLRVQADLVNGIEAVVHDSVITRDDVQMLTEQTADVLVRKFRDQPGLLDKKMNEMRAENLEKLIAQQLILHDFKTAGYNLPESIIEEEVRDRIHSKYVDRMHLTKTLEAEGVTFEKFKERIREQFIVAALRQKNISSEIIISPHKVEVYYLAHRDDFKLEDEVKLRMIVLKQPADPDAPSAEKLGEEILSKLKEGAKFAEMATVYSEGSQRKAEGDWGWWERSRLNKGLGDVAFSMQPGQHSKVMSRSAGEDYWICEYEGGQPTVGRHYAVDPDTKKENLTEERRFESPAVLTDVPRPQEFYLMLVEDKRAAHVKSLGEVRDQIEKDLMLEERNRLEKQWIERLKKKTFIRVIP